jgi:hypothetical protein
MSRIFAIAAGLTLGALLHTATAGATGQATRTFVSGQGSDSNPCTLGAPCRSFAQAITQTVPGGEIAVLDTAGYGVVTINQSVTITNPGGVEAGITTTSGETAITIAAGSNGIVTLRGLTIEGGGVGYRGVDATTFGQLNIIDCVVKDFTDGGIFVRPSTGTSNVVIANTFALNNGASGINLDAMGTATIQFSINQTTASGNSFGINLDASASGSSIYGLIANSHADSNSNTGIAGTGSGPTGDGCGSGPGGLNIQNSGAVNNTSAGISISGTEVNMFDIGMIITGSIFAHNGVGDVAALCGQIFTNGDNDFFNVGTSFAGNVASLSKH